MNITRALNSVAVVTAFAVAGSALANNKVAVAGAKVAATVTPKVDVTKSVVKWEGQKVIGGGHWGHIGIKTADLSFDAKGEPTAAKIVVDVKSIEVKDLTGDKAAGLKGHLQSPDFFDTEKFPEATFVAKKFTKVSGKELKYKVDGDLTIKGTTHPNSFTMEVEKEKTGTKVEGELKFDRTKYNVMFNSGKLLDTAKDKIIKDEVELDIDLAMAN